MGNKIINTSVNIGDREIPCEMAMEIETEAEAYIRKEEREAIKKEYEAYKSLKKDKLGVAEVQYLVNENGSCKLNITISPLEEYENIPDLEQRLTYSMINYFEDLIKNKENPIFELVRSMRRWKLKQQEEN